MSRALKHEAHAAHEEQLGRTAGKSTALVHVFHGRSDQPSQVTASAKILDLTDKEHFTTERILTPDTVTHAMPFDVPLPLGRLASGPYLLTISVTAPGSPPIRRDLRFNIK